MIAPTKHIPIEESLIGVGASILKALPDSVTITALWESCRVVPSVGNFHRFVLALDMLYTLGAIEMRGGVISKAPR